MFPDFVPRFLHQLHGYVRGVRANNDVTSEEEEDKGDPVGFHGSPTLSKPPR
jgi:hypothetical protein